MIEYGNTGNGCRFLRLQWATMRDGVRLATTVVLPEKPGKYPAVIQRTPYNRYGYLAGALDWVRNGYVLIAQDTRGRNDSEGVNEPFLCDFLDTPDTIKWIRSQEWSDGRVGMMGPSYMAWVQTQGIHADRASVPDALLPTFVGCKGFEGGFYHQGVLSLFLIFPWACFDVGTRISGSPAQSMFNALELSRRLPLQTMDVSSGAGVIPFWRNVMANDRLTPYWKQFSVSPHADAFTMPTLMVAGWYDYYPGSMLSAFSDILAAAKAKGVTVPHRILIGPWGHHHGVGPTPDGKLVADFGKENTFNAHPIYRSWYDRIFKGIQPADGLGDRPIRLFVMGANVWRDEDEWPLARTQYVPYYFHSQGHANTRSGDGILSLASPGEQPTDTYEYDPDKPVMTRGGNHSVGPWSDWYKDLIWCGPSDQTITEERADVLVYTSQPLENDLEVTGPVTVKLWASSSAPDTDWVARLVDVYPEGKAINITEGVIRARFRKRDWENPELITPGTALEYSITLHPTSNVFKQGHRLRVQVTSSNFPLWDRNLNTGEGPNTSSRMAVAHQTIYHDATRPSHILLPVIP
jgi:putative CocE/NonD family hydrolase